ncbi:redoxin domain-containing protein [Martelella mediterranea]|uniref:redoxin domain-containing protein n=1 Tax=Martelella mediterranea TaxID=293089 RepID=UPI001E56C620|nr:redoxin domain-containing protein [Martelella mediterranea]MCD1636714.1 redoxin domain-containing protein [Martelella mediterranea]
MIRLLFLSLLLTAQPAFAHHPGERLDEVMTEQEPAFEAAEHPSVPDLNVADHSGKQLRLEDLQDRIVVLSFVPQECGEPCAEQQAVLAAVQAQVNVSPMKEMVTFVTVRDADVSIEAPWDGVNWKGVTLTDGATVIAAVRSFAALSNRDGSLPMAHVIDRNGRHAGIFHGAEFQKTNLTLYINGLINNAHAPKPPVEKTWWDRLTGWL